MDDSRPTKRPDQTEPDRNGPSTIHDVARVAGVSARTVSRVINDVPRVNSKTRRHVLKVIGELNFTPNMRARGLASSRSFMLGFVHDDPNAENVDALQKGLFRVCAKHQYEVLVHPCDYTSGNLVDNVLSFVRRSRIDGVVVIAPASENEALSKALRGNGTPTVGVASVALDNYGLMLVSRERQASAQVARHFIELGHKRIGFIGGPRRQRSASERKQGFTTALRAAGIKIEPHDCGEGDYSFESGLACGLKILEGKRPPTAIYACNDRMAAGLLKAAAQLSIRVPEQLSVAGFDNSYLASVLIPSLTTISRPMMEMGEQAAEWLVAHDPRSGLGQGLAKESERRVFDLQLVLRESTAPPPKRHRRDR
jgi:LacI family transcriptional regulator